MATGRGQFYHNFFLGLLKTGDRAPVPEPPALGRGKSASRGKMKHKTGAAQIHSTSTKPAQHTTSVDLLRKPGRPKRKKNLLERLPSEILLKILSYLDATSLYFLSQVNKQFCHLANDDVLWHKIYMSEFGGAQSWWNDHPRPRVAQGRSSVGVWKQKYFKAIAGQQLNKWRQELKDINPYTGLPRQTEWVLRHLNVTWKLRAQETSGKEVMLKPSKVYFFETSVVLRWSSRSLPDFKQIKNLELFGLREEMKVTNRPLWHSLMLRLDPTDCPRTIGKDRLVKLLFLSPGFIVGLWRGQSVIAFIMICLHFHRLLERSLYGSPMSPYVEPEVSLPLDKSDSSCGLHGYSLHFVLHNTGAEVMSEHFPNLSCHQVVAGLMKLGVIYKGSLSRHRSLSGSIKLPWKTEELEGSIDNCCFMTLTLLDVFQKPFWCVSAPITIFRSKKSLSTDYNGEHFLMDYHHSEGRVSMELVWLPEEKQFFLIDLTIAIKSKKINAHFCTNY